MQQVTPNNKKFPRSQKLSTKKKNPFFVFQRERFTTLCVCTSLSLQQQKARLGQGRSIPVVETYLLCATAKW